MFWQQYPSEHSSWTYSMSAPQSAPWTAAPHNSLLAQLLWKKRITEQVVDLL